MEEQGDKNVDCNGRYKMHAIETSIQNGPVPIPQIFSAHHSVMQPERPACLASAPSAAANVKSPVRSRAEPQVGLATVSGWIAEIRKIWAQGAANTLHLARLMCVIRNQSLRGQWTALWRSGEDRLQIRPARKILLPDHRNQPV